MILVAGATGHVGGTVCRMLVERGAAVRALVRPTSAPDKLAALGELGVELATGDLREPETLAAACAGVRAVVSTASASGAPAADNTVANVDGDGQRALVEAAKAANVTQFVFVSFSGNLKVDMPLHASKRAVEQRIRTSGMPFTILRPTAFMEVWLSPLVGFDVANGSVTIFGEGAAPISYISLGDVAAFCVAAIDHAAARNATIELGGPEAITQLEAVRLAEDVTGRSMRLQHVPREALHEQYTAAVEPTQKSLAGLTWALAGGDAIDMSATLRRFPLKLTTVRSFLQQAYGGDGTSAYAAEPVAT
jgi:uncharacterized protein YbjT (DUF2867 family)